MKTLLRKLVGINPYINIKMKKILLILSFIFFSFGATANSDWKSGVQKDEMSERETFFITTDWISPKYPMSFPYQKTESSIVIACTKNGTSVMIFFRFTTAPNLNDTKIDDGFHKINTRIKFGEKLERIRLDQKWGSKYLSVYSEIAFIQNLWNANEILLELNWHGSNNVYFKYSIKGVLEEIEHLKGKCKIS